MELLENAASTAGTTLKRTLGSAPPTKAYLPWDNPGVEVIQQNEESKALSIADVMNRMQRHNFDQVSSIASGASVPPVDSNPDRISFGSIAMLFVQPT